MKLTEETRIRKALVIHWHRSKWQAAMLVSTLKPTKKRRDNVRSNLHSGQYAASVSSDHSQGQALVEPLALPGVARHINGTNCILNYEHGDSVDVTAVMLKFSCTFLKSVFNILRMPLYSSVAVHWLYNGKQNHWKDVDVFHSDTVQKWKFTHFWFRYYHWSRF